MRNLVICMLALALALTGCQQVAQKATEKAVEQATGVQVSQRGDTVSVKGKDGESYTFGSQTPDELKNFPVPQGFNADQGGGAGVISKGNEKMAMASWKGTGNVQSVSDYYKKIMVDQGWTQEMAQDLGDMAQLSYTKAQDHAVVTISKADQNVTVQVLFSNTAKNQ